MKNDEERMMTDEPVKESKVRRVFAGPRRLIAIAVLICAVAGSAGYAVARSSNSDAAAAPPAAAGAQLPGGEGGSNARSGPAAGGSVGTVSNVSGSTFTLTTSAGEKVTVNVTSSTTYLKGSSAATQAAVTNGASVLVLGTTDSTTITAGQVVVDPATGSGSPGGQVIPFQQGTQSAAQQVGQIPADYTEGDGTVVSGTTAYKATQAALAAYPGGVVDRVVQLSSGEYEVHNIGVNWPHHIFVNSSFQVVGAE
ncbi:hypothetical protein [Kribbella kalugense]|nr:hypothetical protein [Kribbella kalugense]